MKTLLILLLLSSSAFADEWRTSDTYREVAFQTLNVIDWGQTRYIAQHSESFHEQESAWIIGKFPDEKRVDIFMAETAVLHGLISYYLPSKYRSAFQYVTIGMKLNNTIANASIGIKVSF